MKKLLRIATLCLATAALFCLVGCSSSTGITQQDDQAKNRQYMSSVNSSMANLDTQLQAFTTAVGADDLVTMRAEADRAFKTLDEIKALQAPDALKDIQNEYNAGCDDMRDALNGYVQLYSDMQSADSAHPFDYSTFDSRLGEVQEKYDSGIQHFTDGDSKATEA